VPLDILPEKHFDKKELHIDAPDANEVGDTSTHDDEITNAKQLY
jgi:hypothetical protein